VGYLLALNSYITEVVEASERTPSLGRLQGFALFGSAIGFLVGGLLSDWFSIKAPFRCAFVLFMFCSLYVFSFLPWTPPNEKVETRTSGGLAKFFGPLKKFAPQKWVLRDGTVRREYGALLLGIGVFFGILATGYITALLQLYSTDVLGFGPGDNGIIISLNFFLRGLFLAVAFPRIIKAGRKWMQKRKHSTIESAQQIPSEANDMAAIDEAEQEPIDPVNSHEEETNYDFDLFYCKFSLILDGVLTGGATFVRQGWQIYIVAIVIPFAAGTGSASKGTILQMCPASERVDALSGITLIEMIARLSTSMKCPKHINFNTNSPVATLFGLVFAAFTSIGKPYLTFTVNAVSLRSRFMEQNTKRRQAVAVIGFVILLFSKFPPEGSRRYEEPTPNEVDE
jgi:MFS family permease